MRAPSLLSIHKHNPALFKQLLLFVFLLFARSCSACVQLRRLALSEAVVSAVRPLCRVTNVASVTSCAQLCVQEANCAAARHHRATKQCDLLTARFDSLEGQAAVAEVSGDAEVWAIAGRGFGECPASYTASWRSSRYRLSTESATWRDAERKCREEGGKLAELTSQEEMSAVAKQLGTSEMIKVFLGGSQAAGAEEPAGGWSWYRSRLPISPEMWSRGEPNNGGGKQHVLKMYLRSSGISLDDSGGTRRFLCECHLL